MFKLRNTRVSVNYFMHEFISPSVFAGEKARAFVFEQRTVEPQNSVGLGSHCCCLPLEGYIKNTEKLNYGKEHQYKLTVTAYDCGKKRATEDVLVKISIKPTCTPGWQGELPSPLLHLLAFIPQKPDVCVSSFLPTPVRGPCRMEQQD